MEPVSNIDRIVQLLRQKLEERDRTGGKSAASSASRRSAPGTVRGVEALAAINDTNDRQLRRSFIQTLLADQLGHDLVNDAQFQQVVSRVAEAIEQDASAAHLLSRLIDDMKVRLAARKGSEA